MKCLLSSAYWPNLHYFFYVLNSESVTIEQFENYQKQSFRNRAQILSANGVLDLSIPVHKNGQKELSKNITISYKENWHIKHWRAIISAYKNSPYFEHFESEIASFYDQQYEHLLDFNARQLHTILKILQLKKEINFTSTFEKNSDMFLDLREKIHPKKHFGEDLLVKEKLMRPYYQTFESKFAFAPNLSILDLLFNTGLETLAYLEQ